MQKVEGSSPFSRFPRTPPTQARLGARRGLTESLHRCGCVHFAHTSPGRARRNSAVASDYRSSDTDHAANTAHGANTPAIANAVQLRAANQPISYPNTTVSPAPTTSKVA